MICVHKNNSFGFTLLEVVVAVAIFALMASITFPAMIQFLDARERIEERSQNILSLQKAFLFLQKDLRYTLARKLKDEQGEPSEYEFDAGSTGEYLLRITALYPDININGLSVPRMVVWKFEENQLIRLQWSVFEPYIETQPYKQIMLDGVRNIEFRFARKENDQITWSTTWDEDEGIPDGVEAIIAVENNGKEHEYRRLFEMTGFRKTDAEDVISAP